jgi:hypothetical protein
MQCAFCEQPAVKACTKCGSFFCATHGGERTVFESTDTGLRLATAVVCDKCTPDEATIRSVQKSAKRAIVFLIGIGVVGFIAIIVAVVLFTK